MCVWVSCNDEDHSCGIEDVVGGDGSSSVAMKKEEA